MIQYIKGFFKNILNPAISLLSLVDTHSKINKKAKVHRFAKIVNSTIGRYSYVCTGTNIINCDIDDFCSIASNTVIGPAAHTLNLLSTSPIFTEKKNALGHSWSPDSILMPKPKRTKIGSDVWIGGDVTIISGVVIGDGAVIGAGAVVTKNIPPYAIAVGVPAKIVKYRFDSETIKKILASKWWKLSDEILQQNLKLFRTPSNDFKDELNFKSSTSISMLK